MLFVAILYSNVLCYWNAVIRTNIYSIRNPLSRGRHYLCILRLFFSPNSRSRGCTMNASILQKDSKRIETTKQAVRCVRPITGPMGRKNRLQMDEMPLLQSAAPHGCASSCRSIGPWPYDTNMQGQRLHDQNTNRYTTDCARLSLNSSRVTLFKNV